MSMYASVLRVIMANPGKTSAEITTLGHFETAQVLHALIDLTQGDKAPVTRTGTEGSGATYSANAYAGVGT